ncbi:MAG: type I-U CRISPR-associated protein Csb2 [Gammaproteobacteria bacterium]|nr:type I-U CRISPR-associated protein Csb2 [Gammaproteobacteria bacterium]
MLAFGIRYLSGFVAAAEFYDLARAEWPPHPGRIFMAMAAAHFQTGADPCEREALLWLEGSARGGEISPPCIAAPDCMQRAVVRHYVPVNDKAGPSKANMQSLTLTRDRQERTFARASLGDEFVYCLWPDLDPPETHRRALAQLCAKVTRIGHSSSLVQMWMADAEETREPDWLPDESRATIHLRIAGPGTLEYLEQEYNAMAIEDYTNPQVEAETADNVKTRKAAVRRLKDDYGKRPPPQQRPRLSLFQGTQGPLPRPERNRYPARYSTHTASCSSSNARTASTVFSTWSALLMSSVGGARR